MFYYIFVSLIFVFRFFKVKFIYNKTHRSLEYNNFDKSTQSCNSYPHQDKEKYFHYPKVFFHRPFHKITTPIDTNVLILSPLVYFAVSRILLNGTIQHVPFCDQLLSLKITPV